MSTALYIHFYYTSYREIKQGALTMATNEELISQIKSGIHLKSNMYQLYIQNLTLLKSWSKKYIHIIGADEVLQECYIALHNAVKAFDAEKEYKFTTYLQKVIARHFSKITSTNKGLKLGENDKRLLMQYKALNEKAQNTTGKSINDNTACCLLCCSIRQLEYIKQYTELQHPISLDKPINNNTDDTVLISDILQSDTDIAQNYENNAVNEYLFKIWHYVHKLCNETEEKVLIQRFKKQLTYKQIGFINGFSLEQARQYEYKALKKLRNNPEIQKLIRELKE